MDLFNIGIIIRSNEHNLQQFYEIRRIFYFNSLYLYENGRTNYILRLEIKNADEESLEDIIQYFHEKKIYHVISYINNDYKKLIYIIDRRKDTLLWYLGEPNNVDICSSYIIDLFPIRSVINGLVKSPIWTSREDIIIIYSKEFEFLAKNIENITMMYPIKYYMYESNKTEEFYHFIMCEALTLFSNSGLILDLTTYDEHDMFLTIYHKYINPSLQENYKVYLFVNNKISSSENKIYDGIYCISIANLSDENDLFMVHMYNFYYFKYIILSNLELTAENFIHIFNDIVSHVLTYNVDEIRNNIIGEYDLPSGFSIIDKYHIFHASFCIIYRESYNQNKIVYSYNNAEISDKFLSVVSNLCDYTDVNNPVNEEIKTYLIGMVVTSHNIPLRVYIEAGLHIGVDEINDEYGYDFTILPYGYYFNTDIEDITDILNYDWFKKTEVLIILGIYLFIYILISLI